MRRILLLVGLLVSVAAVQVVFGQDVEGVITYEVKMNLHRRIPPERAQMKQMMPEFRTTKQQLFFKSGESLYKTLIEDDDEETTSVSGGGMRMMMRTPNTETYLDQNSGIMLSKQEFLGKEYLIEDSVKVSPWKFGTETKTIAGYECKQAYYTDESNPNQKNEITAWYTDKIRPFLGPERFNTLPGAVLAVDVNNGERVMLAKKIEIKELKKNDLKAPTSGTKISRKEFRALMEEQMKKNGGSNQFIIRN
ncbi:GLPGLI family protein [soil metagenome]